MNKTAGIQRYSKWDDCAHVLFLFCWYLLHFTRMCDWIVLCNITGLCLHDVFKWICKPQLNKPLETNDFHRCTLLLYSSKCLLIWSHVFTIALSSTGAVNKISLCVCLLSIKPSQVILEICNKYTNPKQLYQLLFFFFLFFGSIRVLLW